MTEIERKFRVSSDAFKAAASRKTHIVQGYLNSNPDRTVRVRIRGESGYLTIKGKSNGSGMSRFEWETEISLSEARPLLALCEPGVIAKYRYEVPFGGNVFEVDEFESENQGLIIAEIELRSEDQTFEKPDWLGDEVTSDHRYYNSWLSKNPFTGWTNE